MVSEAWKIRVKGDGLQSVWYKLKNVKNAIKNLHTREFAGIREKIKKWEELLHNIQTDMQSDPMQAELHH